MARKTKGPRPKSPSSRWCMVRDNELLRLLIKKAMEEGNLSMALLSEKSGVHYDKIRQYLKGTYDRKGVNQWELVRMADTLGMKISLNIEFK